MTGRLIDMDLKEEDILGSRVGEHWYYRTKAELLLQSVAALQPDCILDVGAGSAFFSRHLLAETSASRAWCVDTGYQAEYEEQLQDKKISFRRSYNGTDADLMLMMDVLEHAEDDAELLAEYARPLSPGSYLFATVPAFSWLWSPHDTFLGHHRRYTLPQLEKIVTRTGFRIVLGAYAFAAILPAVVLVRSLRRLQKAPPASDLAFPNALANRLLYTLCRAELPLVSYNRAGGLTAFCLARKI